GEARAQRRGRGERRRATPTAVPDHPSRRAACAPQDDGDRPVRVNPSGEKHAMSDDIHEIYAIKYARHERRRPETYIGGDPHDTSEPIDYYVWAITGPSGTFVVDTGFD